MVFDWERYFNDTEINLKPDFSTALSFKESLIKILDSLTVDERMKYSPEKTVIFDKCALRGAPTSILSQKTKEDCLKFYIQKKFITNQQTCYRFQRSTKQTTLVFLSSIAFDPENPGIESSITLNSEAFEHVREFYVYFSPPGEKSLQEMMIPKAFDRGAIKDYNKFGLRYRMVSSFVYIPPLFQLTTPGVSMRKTKGLYSEFFVLSTLLLVFCIFCSSSGRNPPLSAAIWPCFFFRPFPALA